MDEFLLFCSAGIPPLVLYPSFMVLAIVVVYGLLSSRVARKKEYVLWSLLAEYLFVVICSTVVCRSHFAEARVEWLPFWDYIAIVNKTPGVSVWDIILNVVLFLPFGFLLAAIKPTWRWWKIVLLACAFSFSIETMQLIFSKGIAQTDDLMHNTLGAYLGFLIYKGIERLVRTVKN